MTITIKSGLGITFPDGSIQNSSLYKGISATTFPAGTTAQRPTPVGCMIRFNLNTGQCEYYNTTNSAWVKI